MTFGVFQAETISVTDREEVLVAKTVLSLHISFELASLILTLASMFSRHALDDEVGVRRGRLLLDEDVVQDGVLGLFGHLALLDALLQGSGELILVALSGSDAGSVHQSGVALGREDLSDAAANCRCRKLQLSSKTSLLQYK